MYRIRVICLTLAAVVLAGMVGISAWPRGRGVTQLFPVDFTHQGISQHRVAESDGHDCPDGVGYTKGAPVSEKVHSILVGSGCRQALRAAFTRDADSVVVTFVAIRLADPSAAQALAAQLSPLNPALKGLALAPRRLGPDAGRYKIQFSTDGDNIVVPVRTVDDWVVLTTATTADDSGGLELLQNATTVISDYFRLALNRT